ncbi:unnamed protein product [Commensalibacter communis]|uniref:Uncharacterized protein n=1 Tax=Commensalibacter communis TaxID=2972786 RepID=A0A9W4TQW7_9PROT|nr:hypothetical protein [Commensalibacter communis]CAI3953781.1 unnamed protein product [Commensalibacter communis]CAI3956399.1 unnamed protein product [Commensalibacter communis]CAI3956812.1 unnamed protein product [Commensalibacter communis]CAI3956856.1 unnamed protein product [Commensalibacter communis]
MRDLPWGKFWWDKWMNDPALQKCDMAAQGLWMNMVCLMNRCEKIGYLTVNGKPMSDGDIGKRFGLRKDRAERLINILKENGVCSVDENGAIYCRRIVREQQAIGNQNKDKVVSKPVDNLQENIQFDDNRAKSARKSYENRKDNQGKSTVSAISSKKRKEIEFKEKLNKKKISTDTGKQTFPAFVKTACERLQQIAKIDAFEALKQVEAWFEEAKHDGERVLKAIETGWGKAYPVPYIAKVIASGHQRASVKERWHIDGGKHATDPVFQLLSRDNQLTVLALEKNEKPPSWLIKHTQNHHSSAFNYLVSKGIIAVNGAG